MLLGVIVFLTEIQLGFPISIIIITSAKEVTVYDSCLRFSKKLTILMTFLEEIMNNRPRNRYLNVGNVQDSAGTLLFDH